MFVQLKRIFSVSIITIILMLYLGFTSISPAFAFNAFNLPNDIKQILTNQQLIKDAQKFLNTTPDVFCKAYSDHLNGINGGTWDAIATGAESFITVGTAITSASTAGAGSLAGYAGIASAVSQMGLGGVTQAIAALMGSSVTGAAATAVVTSTVGGPLVMGTLLVGGTSAAAFGTYELGKFAVGNLTGLAQNLCNSYFKKS